jgi:transcriptional regulator with XRE-family HTH domain
MSLGKALHELRTGKGMTLADLAGCVNSHVGNLSRIERGLARPSIDLLYRLAAALDISLSDLFAVAEGESGDSRQVDLNAIFLLLTDEDRALLLDFARLVHKRKGDEPSASLRPGTLSNGAGVHAANQPL